MKCLSVQVALFVGLIALCPTSSHGSDTTNLSCGIGVTVSSSNYVQIGNYASWAVALTNASTSNRTCVVTLDIAVVGSSGEEWTNVCSFTATNLLAPGSTNLLSQSAGPNDYAKWSGCILRGLCVLEIQETSDIWLSVSETSLATATNILSIAPSSPIPISGIVTAQVNYLNPYQFPLQGVVVNMAADEFLSTNTSISQVEFRIGPVGTNQYITAMTNFVAGQHGTGHVWAIISGTNLTETSACHEVVIMP